MGARAARAGCRATMQASGQRAHRYERAVLDLVEAAVLAPHVGETFAGVVVQVDEDDPAKGDLVVQQPAVEARVRSSQSCRSARDVAGALAEAEVRTRTVRFEV